MPGGFSMSETELLSYVGAVTGVIGAITGIAGAVMGYYSYHKTNEMKALELRMELMKSGIETFQLAEDLGDLMLKAERSRQAVAAATGMIDSGAMEIWKRQYKADEEALGFFNETIDEYNIDYTATPISELEKRIVEIHSLRTMIKGVADRYLASLADDDLKRNDIKEIMTHRVKGH